MMMNKAYLSGKQNVSVRVEMNIIIYVGVIVFEIHLPRLKKNYVI
jgi:hypothetical protein